MAEEGKKEPEKLSGGSEASTQASKRFLGGWSDKIGNFIANEPFIPYFTTLFALAGSTRVLMDLIHGHYASASNYGIIAGIGAMIAKETFEKSPKLMGTFRKARQRYEEDVKNKNNNDMRDNK